MFTPIISIATYIKTLSLDIRARSSDLHDCGLSLQFLSKCLDKLSIRSRKHWHVLPKKLAVFLRASCLTRALGPPSEPLNPCILLMSRLQVQHSFLMHIDVASTPQYISLQFIIIVFFFFRGPCGSTSIHTRPLFTTALTSWATPFLSE
jgi:hypothetical protein